MDYTIETAFCEDSTRQFIFSIEDQLSDFLSDLKTEEYTFEPMNSYQRMLVHLVASHYQIASRSLEDKKGNKDSNLEENKSSDPPKSVYINKKAESKTPLLKLRDYLTKHQQQKHDSLMKGGGCGGVFRNSSNKTEPKKEEEPVVFKGRGKARWRPDDYDNYKFDGDSTPPYREKEYQREYQYQPREYQKEYQVKEYKEIPKEEQAIEVKEEGIKEVPKDDPAHKQTRVKMLQRINGILGANQPNNGSGIRRQEGQETQQQQKESWRAPEKMTKAISDTRANESVKKSDGFLPSTAHMLILYDICEGTEKETIREIIQKACNIEGSVRLYSPEKGLVVFESERDAIKVSQHGDFEGFKLAKVAANDKQKFSEIFSKEYFNITNLRPKTNKSVALRMINGHLKFK
jgi:hypothetical protein